MSAHPAWHRIMFVGAKTHAVPGSLRADLVADLGARDIAINEDFAGGAYGPGVKRIREWSIDLGGMIFSHEPSIKVRVDNLTIDVLCSHVATVATSLHKSAIRRFPSGREYHKQHGRWHCLVATPRQHAALVKAVDACASEAGDRWAEFYAAWQRRNQGAVA